MINNLKISKDFLTSISYTIFEGLSKGGTHLLLLIVATLISKDLYVKLLLLISAEALMTMMLLSYYTDVLFSFKKDRSKTFLSSIVDISILQYVFFILIYFLFKKPIDEYFHYNLIYVFTLILGNGFLSNIIRYYSVSYQLQLNHKLSIFYKSVPFFLSFICCLLFFIIFNDKVLGFFLGKFLGLLIFYIYILSQKKDYKLLFTTKQIHLSSFLKRAKYSFAIAIVGWLAGLGFINISNLYTDDKMQVLALGLIFNVSSILQLFSNGINQVYVPKLKTTIKESFNSARQYSSKIHKVFFLITGIFVLLFSIFIYFNKFIIFYMPNIAVLLTGKLYIMVIPINFLLNSFQWVYAPYLIVLDKYRYYLMLKLLLSLICWVIIFFSILVIDYYNFIIFLVLLQIIDSLGVYILVKKKINSI